MDIEKFILGGGKIRFNHARSNPGRYDDSFDIEVILGDNTVIGTTVHQSELEALVGPVMAWRLNDLVSKGTYVFSPSPCEMSGIRGDLPERIVEELKTGSFDNLQGDNRPSFTVSIDYRYARNNMISYTSRIFHNVRALDEEAARMICDAEVKKARGFIKIDGGSIVRDPHDNADSPQMTPS